MRPAARMALTFLLLFCSPLSADVVHLKNGGKIEGRVTETPDGYRIETATGVITLEKHEVDRIERKDYAPPPPKPQPPKLRARLDASYAHPFLAFKIQLPARWVRGPGHGKATCSFYGQKDVAFTPRIDLFIERNGKTVAEIAEQYREAFRKAYPDATFEGEEVMKIHGTDARRFLVRFHAKEIPEQSAWTFVAKDGRLYVTSFHCTVAAFDRYWLPIDAAMRSLRIFDEPQAAPEQKEKFVKLYQEGEKAYRDQKWPEALTHFRSAAALLPGWADIHGSIGTVSLKLKRYSDAEQALRKAMEIDAGDFSYPYNLGVCLLQLSKHDEAAAVLRKATELDPESEPACTNLGVAFLAGNQYEEAKVPLERAVELDPEAPAAHYNLGLAYEGLGRASDAQRQFQDTLSLDPKHAGARESLKRLKK